MSANNMCKFDKSGLFVLGLAFGFSIGVAIATWDWFPEEIWWHNPLAVIPQTLLSYFAVLSPFLITLVFLLLRRSIFRSDI